MDKDKKQLAECLWLEINKAIVNSKSVKDYLQFLEEEGMIDFLSKHDFILDWETTRTKNLKGISNSGA